jgi:hypothetical protein
MKGVLKTNTRQISETPSCDGRLKFTILSNIRGWVVAQTSRPSDCCWVFLPEKLWAVPHLERRTTTGARRSENHIEKVILWFDDNLASHF